MSTVFRAADEPVGTRLDYWRQVVGGLLGPLDLQAPDQPDFRDRLYVGQLGLIGVADVWVDQPGRGDRTARHIRESTRDEYQIGVQISGRTIVEQGNRQAARRPGDITVVDLSRPARWVTGPARSTTVTIPRELLPLRPDDLTGLTATRISGDRGLGSLVSSLARQLPRHLGTLDGPGGARLGSAVLDVISTALGNRIDQPAHVPWQTRQRALLVQVHAFIERHLGEPGLTPRTVAAAHHISVRYLHKLFETEQTTVADWIRRRRLERCQRDLLDPRLRTRTVSVIAARWGFTDPAHFSRLFRATFGASPAGFRSEALARGEMIHIHGYRSR
ncbi:helix-turn-helix domain-containing protein [Pseudonocardia humida]|uniref:Helix-turn-helix domain-containing protein n=1 Tax=Pseudonocardia humida TaxID=2800819 RepID=A0ABT1ACX1_9PSEU|nr:helix-turn-helix domain-containing protein [Pseudonocardia humida]MCO1660912.1 helix-turn-helix domain-containing protein [Pseudonocardia humida]